MIRLMDNPLTMLRCPQLLRRMWLIRSTTSINYFSRNISFITTFVDLSVASLKISFNTSLLQDWWFLIMWSSSTNVTFLIQTLSSLVDRRINHILFLLGNLHIGIVLIDVSICKVLHQHIPNLKQFKLTLHFFQTHTMFLKHF